MSERELEEIKNLVTQVRQAPALEAAKLARELSKVVEQSRAAATALDQFAAMSRSTEEAARQSVAEMNRSAEEARQSINQFQEAVLRNERERTSQIEAVLKQQEVIQRMVEELNVGTVGAEIAESQKKLMNLVEAEGRLLREISGRLTTSEKEERNG